MDDPKKVLKGFFIRLEGNVATFLETDSKRLIQLPRYPSYRKGIIMRGVRGEELTRERKPVYKVEEKDGKTILHINIAKANVTNLPPSIQHHYTGRVWAEGIGYIVDVSGNAKDIQLDVRHAAEIEVCPEKDNMFLIAGTPTPKYWCGGSELPWIIEKKEKEQQEYDREHGFRGHRPGAALNRFQKALVVATNVVEHRNEHWNRKHFLYCERFGFIKVRTCIWEKVANQPRVGEWYSVITKHQTMPNGSNELWPRRFLSVITKVKKAERLRGRKWETSVQGDGKITMVLDVPFRRNDVRHEVLNVANLGRIQIRPEDARRLNDYLTNRPNRDMATVRVTIESIHRQHAQRNRCPFKIIRFHNIF